MVHSDHLFPQVGEVSQDVVPEFSLEDFESESFEFDVGLPAERSIELADTDLTWSGSKK